ncbi:MAG: prolipoprotein diacylglyceryl transferase family protein, partial [Desulfobacula sp.]
VLFALLWWARKSTTLKHRMFGLYLTGYGLIRFMLEFFREPDDHLKFVAYSFTMGQVLCLIMIFAGFLILFKKKI